MSRLGVDALTPRRVGLGRRGISAVIVLAAFWWSAFAWAQAPSLDVSQYVHTSWKVRDGFVRGQISAIAQTPDGYIWIGTNEGLFRFDGVRAIPWHPLAGGSLPNDEIRALFVARDGRLWIGTANGLASRKDRTLTRYPEFTGNLATGIAEDADGTVWVAGPGTAGPGRLCAFPKSGATTCDNRGQTFLGTVQLLIDSQGTLWVADQFHVWRWRPGPVETYTDEDRTIGLLEDPDHKDAILSSAQTGLKSMSGGKAQPYPLPGPIPGFVPLQLFRDHEASLWIAAQQKGLVHMHDGRADTFTRADGLTGNWVTGFLEDREGSIWVATTEGLDQFRRPAVVTISTQQGLSNSESTSVLAAKDGSVWLATASGLNRLRNGELTIYRSAANRKQSTPAASSGGDATRQSASFHIREVWDPGVPDDDYFGMFQDSAGRIWTSSAGIAYFENEHFVPVPALPKQQAFTFGEDSQGLWISYRNGLAHWTGQGVDITPWAKLGHEDFAMSMFADPKRPGIWLGFVRSRLDYLENGQLRRTLTLRDRSGAGLGLVSQIQQDEDGALWAATRGGLAYIKDGTTRVLDAAHGLPCTHTLWMTRDDTKAVWIYARCGLIRLTPADVAAWIRNPEIRVPVTVFDASQGVPVIPYTPPCPCVAQTADGRIWFLSSDGISVFDPHHIAVITLPPPVRIEQITADGTDMRPENGLKLPPLTRDIDIDFTGLSFISPQKMRFRYILEGQDRQWREAVNLRHVQYSNLAPGAYRFRVEASNSAGIWNEKGAAFDFSIAPAFWQTAWFRALCILLAVASLGAVYWLRLRQVAREAARQRAIQRDHHELEMELARAYRLATMGQLTATIAHEINQPLAAAVTNAQAGLRWLARQPPELEEIRDAFDAIIRAGYHASDVVARVRDMVKKAPAQEIDVDLNDEIAGVIAITHGEARKHAVTVRTELAEDLPTIRGDRVQLQQVLLNLIVNAIEALSSSPPPREIEIRTEVTEEGQVLLSICDTGPGISADAIDQIFEPFFTSKSSGMGMGLTICRSIIEAHGGSLWATRNKRRGVTFQFRLPVKARLLA